MQKIKIYLTKPKVINALHIKKKKNNHKKIK